MSAKDCQIHRYGRGSCCCNCRWRAFDHSHPYTDGKRVGHRRGYVCLAPEFVTRTGRSEVFSGWSAHGLCEMWCKVGKP